MTEQAIDSFQEGVENDLDGLEWIKKFEFLRASDVGALLWGDSKNSQKYGQRICRKWIEKGYVIKRELPSKAGGAFVLSAGGVRLLNEHKINAKTGKDWGVIKDGKWNPPTEWRHHLIANSFLIEMEARGFEIITENEIRMSGTNGKLPDGILITESNAFWVEVENQRKTGQKMSSMIDKLIQLKKNKMEFRGKLLIPMVVYVENSKDERGYAINHKERVISAVKSISKNDLALKFVKLKMTGLKIDGFEEENTIIESDSISIELKSLERIGTKEIDGITMYPVRGIPCGINKKTLTVIRGNESIKFESMTQAKRYIAMLSVSS